MIADSKCQTRGKSIQPNILQTRFHPNCGQNRKCSVDIGRSVKQAHDHTNVKQLPRVETCADLARANKESFALMHAAEQAKSGSRGTLTGPSRRIVNRIVNNSDASVGSRCLSIVACPFRNQRMPVREAIGGGPPSRFVARSVPVHNRTSASRHRSHRLADRSQTRQTLPGAIPSWRSRRLDQDRPHSGSAASLLNDMQCRHISPRLADIHPHEHRPQSIS